MLMTVETFSGIGAQAKALKNIDCEYKIVGTADWDITAIISYDLIHNGPQDLTPYQNLEKKELLKKLDIDHKTFSIDGKKPMPKDSLAHLSTETLMRLCCAVKRTKNYISVTDIKGDDLPESMNLLTYSFPCQDLSVAHSWHGDTDGISRTADNRSSMLWQIERILLERQRSGMKPLPKFLLMENVPNILSSKHLANFMEWQKSLEDMGYVNRVYKLNSNNFGSPQIRARAYMISVLADDQQKKELLKKYFEEHNLEQYRSKEKIKVEDILKTDYSNPTYRQEAIMSQPNNTPSRQAIFEDNPVLYDGERYANVVPTLTTKQDRNPNSGVIYFDSGLPGKGKYRYLTPRECMLMMGFEEQDFERLAENNFEIRKNTPFLSYAKFVKLAGNSIVVNVLEKIFEQINEIDSLV